MRVLSATSLAVTIAALAALVHASPCDYVITCGAIGGPFPSCSPEAAAEFELVAPALQACHDMAYSFTEGGQWPIENRSLYCDVNTTCGKIIPYVQHVRTYVDVCGKFERFYGLMKTFRGFCRGAPVEKLVGDNGLLAALKSAQTPAPTTSAPMTRPPAVTTTAPLPTTAAAPIIVTPEPTTTPAPTIQNATVSPTAGNGSVNASAASGSNDVESSTVVSPVGATNTTTPAPVPSSSKPSSATSRPLGHAICVTAMTTAIVLWVGGQTLQ